MGPSKEQSYFRSNDYTNPNTNCRTLMTLTLTLSDPHDQWRSVGILRAGTKHEIGAPLMQGPCTSVIV